MKLPGFQKVRSQVGQMQSRWWKTSQKTLINPLSTEIENKFKRLESLKKNIEYLVFIKDQSFEQMHNKQSNNLQQIVFLTAGSWSYWKSNIWTIWSKPQIH